MTKHTPGPWHVVTNKQGYPCQIRASFADHDKLGGIVDVTRWASISLPSSEEGMANARLMAAAPDLLVVLRELVGQREAHFSTFSAWEAARNAIAKAEGKE